MLQQISAFAEQFGVIIPVIVGLVHVLRKSGLATRYAPLVSVLLGAIAGFVYIGQNTTGVLFGIVAGLSAGGAWSGAKTMFVSKVDNLE